MRKERDKVKLTDRQSKADRQMSGDKRQEMIMS